MPTGWGRGLSSKPETPEEKREADRLSLIRRKRDLAKLDRKAKARVLGRAIAAVAVRSEQVTIEDLTQAGFSETEARDLFPDAIVFARKVEPAMFSLGRA